MPGKAPILPPGTAFGACLFLMEDGDAYESGPPGVVRAGGRRWRPAAAQGLRGAFTWRERARQRRDLAALDDRLLRDLGLTRSMVGGEIEKPFWRP
jgi:uncharacterized protein YjiS (DUF1127 family)